jgi:hypothetical protein
MRFLEKLRSLFHSRARTCALGVVLLAGVFGGVPMTPQEIEDHMRITSQAEIVLGLEDEDQVH